MYLEHFGLTEPPFRITPHTDFFFDGANRGATLDALVYAIAHDEGIVKISGEVGSGKTMLCRVLMERLPANVTLIYLANPSLSREDILYAIADELHLDIPANARPSAVLRALQNHLIMSFGEGRQVVVLIDEAHAMPAETLEEIRLLSNLETNHHKLLQLALFGQPELNDILARPDMRQLKERITHNFNLEPLVRNDIASYLDFRMRAAGYRGPSVFSAAAIKLIERSSRGLTRRINILADKALLAAFSAGSHQIGAKEARAAIKDCDFSKATYADKTLRREPAVIGAGILSLGALIGAAWLLLAPSTTPAPPHPTHAIVPAVAPASTATNNIPGVASEPASLLPPTPQIPTSQLSPPVQSRLEAGRLWLEQAPDNHWLIQLFAADADRPQEIAAFLKKVTASTLDMNDIHIYQSALSGKIRYGIVYGEYPTEAAAKSAIAGLPMALRANKPYPRQVSRLR
ncbi:MAG: AAA family ATPase [Rhodocyclales bacterium]|nr:AAA family ATPase [Rhodocyclales bacterium]